MVETFDSMQGGWRRDHTTLVPGSAQARARPAGELPFALKNPGLREMRVREIGQCSQTEPHGCGQSRKTGFPSSARMVSRAGPGPLPTLHLSSSPARPQHLNAHVVGALRSQRSFKLQIAEGVGESCMPTVKTGFNRFFLLNRKIKADWYSTSWRESVEQRNQEKGLGH